MPIDEFDTPPQLAAELVRIADQLCENEPRVVADFAVGTGELLLAAERRWPAATAFGCDISEERVQNLVRSQTEWTVVQCDFLDYSSRGSVSDLEHIRDKVDLVLLNPPFSARGGTKVDAVIDGQTVRCSPAMAFVLLASQYLSHDGYLVALLPAGALESERDQKARATLLKLGEFGAIDGTTERFPGGNPKVTITYFKRNSGTGSPHAIIRNKRQSASFRTRKHRTQTTRGIKPLEAAEESRKIPRTVPQNIVKLLRGTLPNKAGETDEGESIPLVHSTELQGFALGTSKKSVPETTRSIRGPAVLIHRVGKPRRDKVVFVPKGPPFAITDCVVAMLSQDSEQCRGLHRSLTEQYCLLERNYIGSGAPYITLARIKQVLECLEFPAEIIDWQRVLGLADSELKPQST